VRAGGAEIAVNPLPAEGGADAEPLGAAVLRAAGDLARADRTVTPSDAEELVLATPGVGLERAHATLGLHPDFPCADVPTGLSVTAVPHAARDAVSTQWTKAPLPDDGALAAARAQLGAARLIGQEVFVLPPTYRAVRVWVTVSQTSRSEAIKARIADALLRHLDPLVGGPAGSGWPFGGAVRPSALVGVVRSVLGPEGEATALSVALDDEPATDCADLVIGSRELIWLADVQVTWITAVPAGGGLQ
jgi:predicted phage baseplate assembly protein